jgi:hypothetical protein
MGEVFGVEPTKAQQVDARRRRRRRICDGSCSSPPGVVPPFPRTDTDTDTDTILPSPLLSPCAERHTGDRGCVRAVPPALDVAVGRSDPLLARLWLARLWLARTWLSQGRTNAASASVTTLTQCGCSLGSVCSSQRRGLAMEEKGRVRTNRAGAQRLFFSSDTNNFTPRTASRVV